MPLVLTSSVSWHLVAAVLGSLQVLQIKALQESKPPKQTRTFYYYGLFWRCAPHPANAFGHDDYVHSSHVSFLGQRNRKKRVEFNDASSEQFHIKPVVWEHCRKAKAPNRIRQVENSAGSITPRIIIHGACHKFVSHGTFGPVHPVSWTAAGFRRNFAFDQTNVNSRDMMNHGSTLLSDCRGLVD